MLLYLKTRYKEVIITLRWLIDARGCRSQQEIAEKANISQNHYSSIETEARKPSVKVAKRIAAVLGFPWERFYEEVS